MFKIRLNLDPVFKILSDPDFKILSDPDPVFKTLSDPDPVFKFGRIRIRFRS